MIIYHITPFLPKMIKKFRFLSNYLLWGAVCVFWRKFFGPGEIFF